MNTLTVVAIVAFSALMLYIGNTIAKTIKEIVDEL